MSDQPKIGELVLHCLHIPEEGNVDVITFQSPEALAFKRKDGSRGLTNWIICCHDCFTESEGDVNRLKLPGETIWNNKIKYYTEN